MLIWDEWGKVGEVHFVSVMLGFEWETEDQLCGAPRLACSHFWGSECVPAAATTAWSCQAPSGQAQPRGSFQSCAEEGSEFPHSFQPVLAQNATQRWHIKRQHCL